MNYTLIKGTFHVVGQSPDGDSLKFRASNPKNWDKIITENREELLENMEENEGVVQLRLQGVDALETHYSPPPARPPSTLKSSSKDGVDRPKSGSHKQPLALGDAATEALLQILGVERVEWRSGWGRTWIDKAYVKKGRSEVVYEEKYEDEIPGFIVTNDVERNGRPLSWVFAGSTSTRDGSSQSVAQLSRRLKSSINYKLLREGLVYPYFYMTMRASLRNKLVEACRLAYEDAQAMEKPSSSSAPKVPNLWVYDKTTDGLTVNSLDDITEKYELFPYLFRKVLKHWYKGNLTNYWEILDGGSSAGYDANDPSINLEGFFEGGNPYIFVISQKDFLRLDDVLHVTKTRMRMEIQPFDMVFLS
ncbi:MAG: hypothetical protein AAF639_22260 [Chloroflexota bacterium]